MLNAAEISHDKFLYYKQELEKYDELFPRLLLKLNSVNYSINAFEQRLNNNAYKDKGAFAGQSLLLGKSITLLLHTLFERKVKQGKDDLDFCFKLRKFLDSLDEYYDLLLTDFIMLLRLPKLDKDKDNDPITYDSVAAYLDKLDATREQANTVVTTIEEFLQYFHEHL